MFEPLAPQPAYRRVSSAIEQKILKRSLRPGDPLPTETELARQFAVNRSTVREALRQLESAGLVGRPGGGKRLVVTRPAKSETASRLRRALALDEVTFIELWEAMLAIAPRTAALAAQHPVSEDLEPLAQTIAAVESARNSEAAVSAVSDFFACLAALSGNKVLMMAMEPVTGLLAPSLRRMIDRVPQGRSRILVALGIALVLLLDSSWYFAVSAVGVAATAGFTVSNESSPPLSSTTTRCPSSIAPDRMRRAISLSRERWMVLLMGRAP